MPTLRVPDDIWEVAKKAGLEATVIKQDIVQATEVLRYCLEQNIEESAKDFISREKQRKK